MWKFWETRSLSASPHLCEGWIRSLHPFTFHLEWSMWYASYVRKHCLNEGRLKCSTPNKSWCCHLCEQDTKTQGNILDSARALSRMGTTACLSSSQVPGGPDLWKIKVLLFLLAWTSSRTPFFYSFPFIKGVSIQRESDQSQGHTGVSTLQPQPLSQWRACRWKGSLIIGFTWRAFGEQV